MTPRTYSSMEAFVTHWRTLRMAAARSNGDPRGLSATESELLRALDAVLSTLDPAERAALAAADTTAPGDRPPAAVNARWRRRQRALAKLSPILAAAGWLQ